MESLLVGIIRALLPIINRIHSAVLGIKGLRTSSIICVEVRRHRGCPIKLKDGYEVKPGDSIIKLHFNSAWINEQRRVTKGLERHIFPRGFGRYFKDSLQLLATELADGKYRGIVAIYGWTAFHAQAKRFGFQVIDLPDTVRIKLARLHITALMETHRIPWFRKHATRPESVKVRAVWLSRAELLRIHGQAS